MNGLAEARLNFPTDDDSFTECKNSARFSALKGNSEESSYRERARATTLEIRRHFVFSRSMKLRGSINATRVK